MKVLPQCVHGFAVSWGRFHKQKQLHGMRVLTHYSPIQLNYLRYKA